MVEWLHGGCWFALVTRASCSRNLTCQRCKVSSKAYSERTSTASTLVRLQSPTTCVGMDTCTDCPLFPSKYTKIFDAAKCPVLSARPSDLHDFGVCKPATTMSCSNGEAQKDRIHHNTLLSEKTCWNNSRSKVGHLSRINEVVDSPKFCRQKKHSCPGGTLSSNGSELGPGDTS